jgi:hypothetical protein
LSPFTREAQSLFHWKPSSTVADAHFTQETVAHKEFVLRELYPQEATRFIAR